MWVTVCGLALIVATCLPAFAATGKVDFPQKGKADHHYRAQCAGRDQ